MTPRTTTAATLLLGLLPLACGGARDVAARPNVIVVVLDTLRADHLGVYGYDRPTSPRLDAFAEGCVVFEDAQSAAPWTAPSLLSIMTSLYPEVHGVRAYPNPGRMNERVVTLAEVLRERGWATAAFTEGGYAKGEFGLDQGFDVYPANEGDEESHTSNAKHPSRLAANMDRALEWLDANADDPFFLFFHTYEVHSPLRAPDEDVRALDPDYPGGEAVRERTAEIARRWRDEGALDREGYAHLVSYRWHADLGDLMPQEEQVAAARYASRNGLTPPEGAGFHPETLAFVRDQYDAEIRFTDRELDRLWVALEERGLAEDTIVVVVSDHGEGIGEHGNIGHGKFLYDYLMRVVMLLRAPGLPPQRIDELVRTVDVMPTVMELAGIDPGTVQVQGRSLVPLVRGEPLGSPAYGGSLGEASKEDALRSVTTSSWRYVEGEGGARLYDRRADPGETNDVADEHPDVARRLAEELARIRAANETLSDVVSGAVEPTELSPADLERLRELGYID